MMYATLCVEKHDDGNAICLEVGAVDPRLFILQDFYEIAIDAIIALAKRSGHKATDMVPGARLRIEERDAVRIALIIESMNKARHLTGASVIVRAIAGMSEEETYYWYSKMRSNKRAIHALLMLEGAY